MKRSRCASVVKSLSRALPVLALITALLSPLSAKAAPLAFPSVVALNATVSTVSLPHAIIFSSNASAPNPFTIGTVTLAGPDAANFSITTNNCNGRIFLTVVGVPPPVCEVNVEFNAPASTGNYVAVVNINNAVGTTIGSVPVTGTALPLGAPAMGVAPTNINFGLVLDGSSNLRIVQVVNTGGADLPLNAPTLSLGNQNFFIPPTGGFNTCESIYGNILPPGQDCLIGVSYEPGTAGIFNADTLNISSSDTSIPPAVVTLFGFTNDPPTSADLSIIKSADPAQVTLPPGGPVTYTFTVTNSSTSANPAGNVIVRDVISGPFAVDLGTLPAMCTVLATTDPLVQEVICNVWDINQGGCGILNPGDTCSFQIQGTVDEVGQVDDMATVEDGRGNVDLRQTVDPYLLNNFAVASTVGVSTSVLPQANLRVIKEADNLSPAVGSTLTYQIHVRNTDPSVTATNLTLRDITVGNILNLNVSASGGWSCITTGAGTNPPNPPNNPRRVECTRGSLAPLTTSTITLTGTVSGTEPITNTATVFSTGTQDPDISDNTQTVAVVPTDPQAPSGDLSITKTITSAPPFTPGNPINYQIVVTNNGPALVTNAVVIDRILGDFTGPVGGAGCDSISNQGNTYFCQIAFLAASGSPGDSRVITYSVTPNSAGVLSNIANVTGPINDTNSFNDEVTVNAAVAVPEIDLSVSKTFTGTSSQVGVGNAVFTITVTNESGIAMPAGTTFTLTDISSGPIANIVASSGQMTCNPAVGNSVECTSNALLGAGASATITVTGDIIAGGVTNQIDNIVSVSSDTFADPNMSNNTAVASVIRGVGVVDLSITKSVDLPQSVVGDTVTYTLNVANNSATAGTNVVVTDTVSGPIDIDDASVIAAGCTVSGAAPIQVIRCNLGAFSGTDTITYTGEVLGNGQIDNIASIDDTDALQGGGVATFDPDTSNNAAVASTVTTDPNLPDADLSVTKEVTSIGTSVGDPVTFTVTVRNNGPTAVPPGSVIQVTDITTGPINTVSSVTPGCSVNANNAKQIDCSLAAGLAVNGTTVVLVNGVISGLGQIDNTVTVSSQDVNDINLSNNTAVASLNGSAPVLVSDLRVLKSVDLAQVQVGQSVTFDVRVRNLGPDDAANVTLTDVISGQFTVTGALPAACSSATPANPANVTIITCNYANIASGGARTLTVTGTVDAQGVVSNTASAYSTVSVDPLPSNNVANAATNGVDEICGDGIQEGFEQCDDGNTAGGDGCSATCQLEGVDLSVTKVVSAAQAVVGDVVSYTVTVQNNEPVGGLSTANAVLTDLISGPMINIANVTIDAGTCNAPVNLGATLNRIDCTLGVLAPQQVVTLTYDAEVSDVGQIDNIVSVDDTDAVGGGVATADPNLSNNSAVASLIGTNPALPDGDLAITKTAIDTTVDVGQQALFTVTVTNNGPDMPVGSVITVTDLPSSNFSGLTITSNPGGCAVVVDQIQCTINNALASGSSLNIGVGLTVDADGPIVNLASVSSNSINDTNPSNNSAAAAVNGSVPVNSANIRVIQTVSPAQSQVGDVVTFTVNVANNGPDNATDVSLHNIITGPFQINSVTPAGGATCNAPISSGPGEQRINCVGDLNDGQNYTVTIVGEATGQGVISNSATASPRASSNFTDPRLANNTATASFLAVDSVCGDGLVEAGEQCDDGNVTPGDGCSDTCQYETVCGDGLQEGLEQCDDGNNLPGDGCDDLCRLETVCGDNLQEGVEQCDDGNTLPGDGCDEFCRLEGADLSIVKAVDRAQAAIGEIVTFTLTVTNSGPRAATNVVVTDQLVTGPNTFTITAISPSTGSCTPTPPQVGGSVLISCTLGQMDPDDVETIIVTGTVDGLGQVDNTASVADTNSPQGGVAQVDPNPSNNVSVASVNGTAVAVDLSINKVSSAAQAGPDQDVTFTITINNPSASTVSGVVVTDQIDGPFTINTINSPGFTCPATPIASPSTIICTPTGGALASGASVITMTGRVTGEGQVDNTVSIDSSVTSDPNHSNNTSVASVIGVARETDLSVTKTVDFPQATVGDTVTFTVVVTNNDEVNNAEGVRITDIATGPMQVQSMAFTVGGGTCTPSAALPASAQPFLTFVCIPTAGEIGPGGQVEITMIAEVTGEGQIDNTVSADATITHDPDQSNNTALASVNGAAMADLRVTKTVTNGPIFNIGDTVDFEIVIENRGPNDATNVTLTDMQLGGLSFDAPPAGCSVAGNNMTCDVIAFLASGDSVTVNYSSTANVAGLWSNIVTVSSDVEDRIMSNNTTSANVSVGILANTADLEVTKTADVSEIKQGGDINYTITVTNNGPDEATDVVLNDFIAGPFDSVSNIQINPVVGACSELNGLLTCTVPSVPMTPGFNSFTVTYTVTTSEPGAISNLAVVAGAVLDPIQENNSAAYQVNVVDASADISISKVVNPNPGLVGDTFTYTLLVRNAGPDTARNVIAVDQISGHFDNVTADSTEGSCTVESPQEGASRITCELGDMTSGSTVTITVTVTGDGLFSILSNLASAYSDTHDPVLGNNAATADTIQLEGPSPTNQPILEGSGAFGQEGGCSLASDADQSVPWAAIFLVVMASAWVFARRRRFEK